MRRLASILAAFLASSALAQTSAPTVAGTVTVGTSETRIDGSGRRIDDVRAVGSFSAVRASGPVDILLKATGREQVTVQFDDNLLPLIETRVLDESVPTLDIRVLPGAGFRSSRAPKVTIEFKSISALALSGSGDVNVDAVRGPMLAVSMVGSGDVKIDRMDVDVLGVSISGSGDFKASGRAAEQGYSIAGSGDISASNLVGQTVKVRIAGNGDARVHANQLLDVSIAGGGDVIFRGSPIIRKSIAGSGEVRRAD